MSFSLIFPHWAVQTATEQQRNDCSHIQLTLPVMTWAGECCHLDSLSWQGYPICQHAFVFALSCCLCLETKITWEKLKSTIFSLSGWILDTTSTVSADHSNCYINQYIKRGSSPHPFTHTHPPSPIPPNKPLALSVLGNKILIAQVCTISLQITSSQVSISVY